MKKVIFLVVSALMALFMSGCAGKQVEPNPVYVSNGSAENSLSMNISLKKKGSNNLSEIQELSILIKKAAEEFDKKGVKYFTIGTKSIPGLITNIEDLNAYCYPKSNGFHINETKSSSLEDEKCKGLRGNLGIMTGFLAINEPIVTRPTWSVKEVLSNKNIDKFIEAGLEDGEFENKTIKYTSDWKEYEKSMKNR